MNPSDSESAGINEAATAFSELLEAMIAARQLTAADAGRSSAQNPRTSRSPGARVALAGGEYGVGFATLDELEPDKQILSLFPRACFSAMNLLPLRRIGQQIEVATSRLFATQGLDGLKAITGLRLQPVLAPPRPFGGR